MASFSNSGQTGRSSDKLAFRNKKRGQRRAWFRVALTTAPELTATTVRVGLCILEHFNSDNGFARPGTELLAEEACTRRETVLAAINTLEARGWYHIVRGRGRGNSHRYTPCWESVRSPDILGRLSRMGAVPQKVRLNDIKCEICASEKVVVPVQEPLNRTSEEPKPASPSTQSIAGVEAGTSRGLNNRAFPINDIADPGVRGAVKKLAAALKA